MATKTLTERYARIHFDEFLETIQHEPVIITRNNQPVGIMMSMEDAAEAKLDAIMLSEMNTEKEPGYDEWLYKKVTGVMERIESRKEKFISHEDLTRKISIRRSEKNSPLIA